MRENQQLVYDILSDHAEGMTLNELKTAVDARKTNLILKKIIKPLQEKDIIEFDGNKYKAKPITVQEKISNTTKPKGIKAISIEGKSQNEVKDLLKNTNYSLKAVFRRERALSDDECLRFFIYTVEKYKALINKYSASPAVAENWRKEYFRHKDRDYVDPTHTLNEEQYTFKSMVCHAQNKTGGVDFTVLDSFCCGYDLDRFLLKPIETLKAELGALFPNKTPKGLSDLEKTISSIALFLSKKTETQSMPDYITDKFRPFECRRDNHYRIPGKFKSEKIFGFAEALSFDFLKEYCPYPGFTLFDFPKPDLHVKRTIVALFHDDRTIMRQFVGNPTRLNSDSINTIYKNNTIPNAMGLYLNLMSGVNREISARVGINAPRIKDYLLDKMIYLICSGKLYLQGVADDSFKIDYLKGILDDSFLSTTIPASILTYLADIL